MHSEIFQWKLRKLNKLLLRQDGEQMKHLPSSKIPFYKLYVCCEDEVLFLLSYSKESKTRRARWQGGGTQIYTFASILQHNYT